jgi:hypothetical protein
VCARHLVCNVVLEHFSNPVARCSAPLCSILRSSITHVTTVSSSHSQKDASSLHHPRPASPHFRLFLLQSEAIPSLNLRSQYCMSLPRALYALHSLQSISLLYPIISFAFPPALTQSIIVYHRRTSSRYEYPVYTSSPSILPYTELATLHSVSARQSGSSTSPAAYCRDAKIGHVNLWSTRPAPFSQQTSAIVQAVRAEHTSLLFSRTGDRNNYDHISGMKTHIHST